MWALSYIVVGWAQLFASDKLGLVLKVTWVLTQSLVAEPRMVHVLELPTAVVPSSESHLC